MAAACGSSPSTPASSPTDADISAGLAAQQSGQTQQAINDFNAAASKSPTNPIPYYDLGVIYQLTVKDSTKAAVEYNKAISVNSKYQPALFNLAILDTPSNPQGAINLYNELLAINPNDANVNFNLGLLLIQQGQTAAGQSHLQKAIFLKPALRSRVPKGITP